jgi:hypothetical protein
MTTQPIRSRTKGAAVTLCGVAALGGAAAIAIAACASPASATASAARQPAAATATAVPVVVDCAAHPQTRPGQYTLACADGNASLTGLRWASWGSTAAFAEGTSTFNDCTPSCVAGHGHSFPALITLWRTEPLPGHHSQRYFTRLTLIYTGNRAYQAGGKHYQLPQTVTYPLSQTGGA